MTIKKWLLIVLSCIFSANALATREPGYDGGGLPFVATLSMGPAWARPAETQTIYLQLDMQKTYVPSPFDSALKLISTSKGTNALFSGELFLGLHGAINSVVEGQIGLAIGGTSSAKLKGIIWEDSNVYLNNYSYAYTVSNKRVALKLKALYDVGVYDLFPYLSGSAGVGINNSSGFTINPLIPTEVPAPIFSNHSVTEFSYTLGLGLETELDDGWRVGLGYEFADWGLSHLGPAVGQRIGHGLKLSSLRTHELVVSVSFLS